MPRPNQLHDDLDALLDGRPVELTEGLAPLVEAAGALRAELATFQLDPEVADQHLERVLVDSATVVPMPVRQQPSGWELRRRMAAVVLAAALVLAPATMASAAALPGQAMYPFKLAIEQLRVASVQWSPAREAGERTRVADTRLGELERLVQLELFNQVLPAIRALNRAVQAADAAVREAAAEGAPVAGLQRRLSEVRVDGQATVEMAASTVAAKPLLVLPRDTFEEIQEAAKQAEELLAQPGQAQPAPAGTPTSSTAANQPATPPSSGSQPNPTPSDSTRATEPSTSQTTSTTSVTTTTLPPTTTSPPPTTAEEGPEATPGSAGEPSTDPRPEDVPDPTGDPGP